MLAHARRALCAVAENDPARRYPLCALAGIALFEGRLTDAVQLISARARWMTSSSVDAAAGHPPASCCSAPTSR